MPNDDLKFLGYFKSFDNSQSVQIECDGENLKIVHIQVDPSPHRKQYIYNGNTLLKGNLSTGTFSCIKKEEYVDDEGYTSRAEEAHTYTKSEINSFLDLILKLMEEYCNKIKVKKFKKIAELIKKHL